MRKPSLIVFLSFAFYSCTSPAHKKVGTKTKNVFIVKSDSDWQKQLSPLAYQVMRKGTTERAFSSPLDKN